MRHSAFNNNPKFKQKLIDMALEHQASDDYIRGTYGKKDKSGFKGCSVGCTVYDVCKIKKIKPPPFDDGDSVHELLAQTINVPSFVVSFQDYFFESISQKFRREWPIEFLKAIPCGSVPGAAKVFTVHC